MKPPSLTLLLLSVSVIPVEAELVFGTVQVPPFAMRKKECYIASTKQTECWGNSAYEGYCVDLMAILAKEIEEDYRIEIRRKPGAPRPDGSWDGLVEDLNDTRIDVAVAAIAVTPETAEVVDFSPPFLTGGLSLMIKKPEHRVVWVLKPLNPFSAITWIAIVLLQIVSLGTAFVLLTHSRQAKEQENGRLRFYILISFLLLWMICSFMMITFVVGHLCSTSEYNAQVHPTPYIDSVEELMAQEEVKYGMQSGGDYDTHRFFRNSNESLHKKMLEMMEANGEDSFTEYYKKGIGKVRDSDGKFAFIIDDAVNRYENTRLPCDTRKIGANVATYHYAVATQKGSHLSEKIYRAIEILQRRGEIAKIHKKWFVETSQCPKESDGMEMSEVEKCIPYVFYAMIAGITLSIVASLIAVHFEEKRANRREKFTEEAVPMTQTA